jgi:hypothetical protein
MNTTNATAFARSSVKLTLAERRVVSKEIRGTRLYGEFEGLEKLDCRGLDEKVAELELITRVLWNVDGSDLHDDITVSDVIIADPRIIEFLREVVVNAGLWLNGGGRPNVLEVRVWNRLEEKFGLDRRWLFDEAEAVAA